MKPTRNTGQPEHERTIDWHDLRRRLAEARTALARELTVGEQQQILQTRALALARPPEEEAAAGQCEVLEFRLAYETYGLEMAYVRETFPLTELTPLPGTPSFVLGLTNVRGQILSVIDLKKFFGLPEKGLTDLNKIIIVHDGDMEFGVLADEILGVRPIQRDQIQPALPTMTGVREEYLLGVSRARTVILDGRKLATARSIIVNDEE